MFIKNMKCILFADDSTLSQRNSDLKELLLYFNIGLNYLNTWCKNHRLNINWSKTFVMFVTNKHINLPNAIEFNGNSISVVSSVKLLGVTIDNKLNFAKYVGDLRLAINKRLYSIKNLFFLPTSVKIQFFKSFILPYFDYCSTLLAYFNKQMIQKLSNCYNKLYFRNPYLQVVSQTIFCEYLRFF